MRPILTLLVFACMASAHAGEVYIGFDSSPRLTPQQEAENRKRQEEKKKLIEAEKAKKEAEKRNLGFSSHRDAEAEKFLEMKRQADAERNKFQAQSGETESESDLKEKLNAERLAKEQAELERQRKSEETRRRMEARLHGKTPDKEEADSTPRKRAAAWCMQKDSGEYVCNGPLQNGGWGHTLQGALSMSGCSTPRGNAPVKGFGGKHFDCQRPLKSHEKDVGLRDPFWQNFHKSHDKRHEENKRN